jgi:HJR/Mrr/RecB family endonuclease
VVFRLVTQALGTIGLVLLAVIALVWQWAAEHPLWALVIGAGLVWLSAYGMRLQRAQRLAIQNDAHVPSMSPLEYEQFVARELERAGWRVKHIGTQGDQGCDVLARMRGVVVAVQAKKWNQRVGNSAVQEVVAAKAMYSAHACIVVAPFGYTTSARKLAEKNRCLLLRHSDLGGLERLLRIPPPAR